MNRGISYDAWLQDEKAYEEYAGDEMPQNPLNPETEMRREEEIARGESAEDKVSIEERIREYENRE